MADEQNKNPEPQTIKVDGIESGEKAGFSNDVPVTPGDVETYNDAMNEHGSRMA